MEQLTPIQTFVANFIGNHKVSSILILIGIVVFFLLLENWRDWFIKPRGPK